MTFTCPSNICTYTVLETMVRYVVAGMGHVGLLKLLLRARFSLPYTNALALPIARLSEVETPGKNLLQSILMCSW